MNQAVARTIKPWPKAWQLFFATRKRYSKKRYQSQLETIANLHIARMQEFWTRIFKQHMRAVMPLIGKLELHAMKVTELERQPEIVLTYTSDKIEQDFARLERDAGAAAGRYMVGQLGFEFHGLPAKTQTWLDNYVPKIVQQIGDTTKKGIMGDVYESIKKGESLAQTEERIRNTYTSWIDSRPVTIARTEVGTVMQTAAFDSAMEAVETSVSEDEEIIAIWLTAGDERVRESHIALNEVERPLGESFLEDAELKYPLDPDGPPEETINCRCVLLYEVRQKEGVAPPPPPPPIEEQEVQPIDETVRIEEGVVPPEQTVIEETVPSVPEIPVESSVNELNRIKDMTELVEKGLAPDTAKYRFAPQDIGTKRSRGSRSGNPESAARFVENSLLKQTYYKTLNWNQWMDVKGLGFEWDKKLHPKGDWGITFKADPGAKPKEAVGVKIFTSKPTTTDNPKVIEIMKTKGYDLKDITRYREVAFSNLGYDSIIGANGEVTVRFSAQIMQVGKPALVAPKQHVFTREEIKQEVIKRFESLADPELKNTWYWKDAVQSAANKYADAGMDPRHLEFIKKIDTNNSQGSGGTYFSWEERIAIAKSQPDLPWATEVLIHEHGHHTDMFFRPLVQGDIRSWTKEGQAAYKKMHDEFLWANADAKQITGITGRPFEWRKDRSIMEANAYKFKSVSWYAVHDSLEWFAESWEAYFHSASERADLQRKQPETYKFMEQYVKGKFFKKEFVYGTHND